MIGQIEAIVPVMPRGVEHRCMAQQCSHIDGAIFPVMPRGVEHLSRDALRVMRDYERFFL